MSSSRGVIPQDAVNINEILRSQGVVEYNPEIITQLLEFSYRYTSELLSDADDYRENAGRTLVSKKDVDLAIAIQGKLLQHSQPSQAVRSTHIVTINELMFSITQKVTYASFFSFDDRILTYKLY